MCSSDLTTLATAIWPALTTIHQPVATMASDAVKLLINQIRKSRAGEKAEIVHRLLDFTLISRQSTASLKKARPGD